MDFCCEKFKKDYQSYNTCSNSEIAIGELNDVEKTRFFLYKIWNVKNKQHINIVIKYCPYCGECLAKFYTDDTYINVIIEDVSNEEASTKNIENTQQIQNATRDSLIERVKSYCENRNEKIRRENELDMCCNILEYFYDQPKLLVPLRFVVTKSVLEKSVSDYYIIEKEDEIIKKVKRVKELSFNMLSQNEHNIISSPKEERRIAWNFCPFCGENLYNFYNNTQYANDVEGRDFAFPEPESSIISNGGLSKKMLNILLAISAICFIIYVSTVKQLFVGIASVWPYFVVPVVSIYFIRRIITFKKNSWMQYAWKSFWANSAKIAFILTLYVSGTCYFIFDTLNSILPTENKPYLINATIDEIHFNKGKRTSKPSLIFKFDNGDNNYSRRLNEMEFLKDINREDMDDYKVGDRYVISFKDGFFGMPMFEDFYKAE